MTSIILGVILILIGMLVYLLVKLRPIKQRDGADKKNPFQVGVTIASVVFMLLGTGTLVGNAVAYNDAGFCQHIRDVRGKESSACNTGWFFLGWGTSTSWPHYITVANSVDENAEGSSITPPYRVRLADNWTGDVIQVTRFGIPQDAEQFIKMARDFRSPERLITTTLKPAVTASIDSVANMFTMEEYYAGGRRDNFKSEFALAVQFGRAKVKQVSLNIDGNVVRSRASASNSEVAQNTSEVGDTDVRSVFIEKLTDDAGNDIRIPHDFSEYGIIVSSAILENVDPDDVYESQIGERKAAASRRVVAREQRLEQEEQRLLAIQAGETDIAKRQAAAQVEQIEQTTNAETSKKLALINAEQMREQARIAKETAEIELEKARIDAQSVQVAADAQAHAKRVILEADGALAQKLEAWVKAQEYWAQATANINVPSTVIGNSGSSAGGVALDTVGTFMQMLMVKTAKDLAVDVEIKQ